MYFITSLRSVGSASNQFLKVSVPRPLVDRPLVDRPLVDRPLVDRPLVDRPLVDRPMVSISSPVAASASWVASTSCSKEVPSSATPHPAAPSRQTRRIS